MSRINLTEHRKHKLTNSYRVRDYYNHYKKNHNTSLTESEYSAILSDIFQTMIDDCLLNFVPICLPYKLGVISVGEYKPNVTFENGKYKYNGPVDWKKTLDLWDEDPESRADKRIIYTPFKKILYIKYTKEKSSFKNQMYMYFKEARSMRKYLSKKLIMNDNFNIK